MTDTRSTKSKETTKHRTGTRKEWLAARLELLKAEKEHTHRADEVARRRQALPWVRIDKTYRFGLLVPPPRRVRGSLRLE